MSGNSTLIISEEPLHFDHIRQIISQPKCKLKLSATCIEKINNCRIYLENKLKIEEKPIYGINTGFGFLCNTSIEAKDLSDLQTNLIRSHACGMGDEISPEIVRLMLLFKVKSLSLGHSGVRLETVNRLIEFFNAGITPVIYSQGSLGASGDLAPLAHLSLPLIGEGEVDYQGERISAALAHEMLGIEPLTLQSKEGLALLNGTQFMLSLGTYALIKAYDLADWADFLAASSLDAFDGRTEPFDADLHAIRPHPGQIKVAENIRKWIEGSQIAAKPKTQVQDPYSFRCVPQVHGASRDAFDAISLVFEREMNSVSDNPNIFIESDKIISGGNFHGQPLAIHLDFLAIALAELGSISERRVFQLLSGQRGLPLFLVASPGLHSGLMIAQYTAASILTENKGLCFPASVDTIPSSNGQEDHVSMGAYAAVKCLRVLDNVRKILGIELLTASQALYFRNELSTSPQIAYWMGTYRETVSPIIEDRELSSEMRKTARFIAENLPKV